MPIYWTEPRRARYGTCSRCGGDWSLGDRDEPAFSNCTCEPDDVDQDPREPGDDDGREYADPRDAGRD